MLKNLCLKNAFFKLLSITKWQFNSFFNIFYNDVLGITDFFGSLIQINLRLKFSNFKI